MQKQKRENKTKEQIAKEIQTMQKVKLYRAFVKDEFYPLLLTATTSIDDAKFLLTGFANMVFEQFLTLMKEKKFSELNLEAKLDPENPNYEEVKKILVLFGDKTVFEARELIEGMRGEIDGLVNAELKERKLETLKTNWFDVQ